MHTRRFIVILIVSALVLGGQWTTLITVAAPQIAEQCFPQTNQCISEPFLGY